MSEDPQFRFFEEAFMHAWTAIVFLSNVAVGIICVVFLIALFPLWIGPFVYHRYTRNHATH